VDSVFDIEKPGPETETVFTVTDYWDGPLQGIANHEGKPHFYERIFDEASDDYSDLYRLTPINESTFRFAMEAWNIWRRWEAAFHAGNTSQETHPALPEDRARHEELRQVLTNALESSPNAIVQKGNFSVLEHADTPKGVMHPLQVLWTNP